jgi:diguanylate cyclase (GGDEF)-like protein
MNRPPKNHKTNQSLRFFVIPSVLCFILAISVVFVMLNQRQGELGDLENRSQLQTSLLSEKIAGKVHSLELVLTMVSQSANSLDFSKTADIQKLIALVKSQLYLNDDLEGVCILAPSGSKIYSSFYADTQILKTNQNRLLIAHTQQDITFSMFSFLDHGIWHLVISRSLFDKDGKLAAIVGLVKETDSFFDLLSLTKVPGIEKSVLFDTPGNIIAMWSQKNFSSEENASPYENIEAIPSFADSGILDTQENTINSEIKTVHFKNSLLTTVKLESIPFTLGLETQQDQAMASYDRALAISISILFLFIIIALTVIILLGGQVIEQETLQQHMMDELSEKVRLRTADLEKLSNLDSLTGLINRRKINSLLAEQIDEEKGSRTSCCIMIIDIDHFKMVNDTFGHQTGDEVLIHIVRLLQKKLSEHGTLSRWGGDELLALLPSHTAEQAFALAQILLADIVNTPFSSDINNTLSIGIAQYREGESSSDLIRRSDNALYEAKGTGRNRAICG